MPNFVRRAMPQPRIPNREEKKKPSTGMNPMNPKTSSPSRTAATGEIVTLVDGRGQAFAENEQKDHPAEDLDDHSDHDEREHDGDADEDQAEHGGEGDENGEADHGQQAGSERRPEIAAQLARRRR